MVRSKGTNRKRKDAMLRPEQRMTDHYTAHTDELVRRCQQGERQAFNELVLQERNRIYGLAYRITGSTEELDDLVQDIFLRVYCNIGRFRFESQFSTWLTRVAVNECRKKLKQRKRRRQVFAAHSEFRERAEEASTHLKLQRAKQESRNALLHKAIERLSEKHRLVIVLRYFGGHSCEDISQILDCKVGTVYSRLHNALRRLRDSMEAYDKSL